MLFGHNSNVTVAGTVYHVQTEDRGVAQASIDTTVYHQGRVLHRRTSKYSDLLPLSETRAQTLKKRVEDQHRRVVEEMRSGALALPVAPPAAAVAPPPAVAPAPVSHALRPASAAPPAADALKLELLNAKSWMGGKRATLRVAVRKEDNSPVESAQVTAKIEGAEPPAEITVHTGDQGYAELEFELPPISGSGEHALIIEATKDGAKARLRYQMRLRPRVPLG